MGDTLLLAQRPDKSLLVVIARQDSEVLTQLEWLFDFHQPGRYLLTDALMESQPVVSPVTAERVLTMLGIPLPLADGNLSELLIDTFPGETWPTTQVFASFARKHFGEVDAINEPDATLSAWVEHEHKLFRTLEKYKISEEIRQGFLSDSGDVDVDAFISMSLRTNNRRKSRAGLSLELHMEAILKANAIRFVKKSQD
ncbi:type II restriction endonuclease [Arthrobacter sp. SD76]|uniref:type II restriction endonuclease n=1 Tax=Arthrobacter sp. SD76 TaxID=3415007 RepID=UPI003C72D60F